MGERQRGAELNGQADPIYEPNEHEHHDGREACPDRCDSILRKGTKATDAVFGYGSRGPRWSRPLHAEGIKYVNVMDIQDMQKKANRPAKEHNHLLTRLQAMRWEDAFI